MRFSKYHGLGNDYLVIDEMDLMQSPERVRTICDRNFGIGSDGILFGPLPSKSALAGLRIFNPDGSEAEKSGNGIRIFCRHLWERGSVGNEPFLLETPGGIVRCRVRDPRHEIDVEMGTVNFWSDMIPVTGERREVLQEVLDVNGESLKFSAATIGNPHCVIFRYTLASGSSASAAAAVARRLGFCGPNVRVQMPGGELRIAIGDQFSIVLTGPVTKVGYGTIYDEIF